MNHLLREIAPVPETAWAEIEAEATRTLRHFLTARRIVDIDGPSGWTKDSVARGRAEDAHRFTRRHHRHTCARCNRSSSTAPSSHSRAPNSMRSSGARSTRISTRCATPRASSRSPKTARCSTGTRPRSIQGIAEATPHDKLPIDDDYRRYPSTVARAVALLQAEGVAGPYAIALGPRCYTGVIETTEMGGYPLLEHLRLIAGGPLQWAPAVDGAVVLSTRGDDFKLTIGQDVAIGYLDHDAEASPALPRGVVHVHGAHARGGRPPRVHVRSYCQ